MKYIKHLTKKDCKEMKCSYIDNCLVDKRYRRKGVILCIYSTRVGCGYINENDKKATIDAILKATAREKNEKKREFLKKYLKTIL